MEDTVSYPNRTCKLECLKDNKELGGFTGLVKIVLVQTPKFQYCIKLWWAGFVGLAYILMGATTSIVCFFCLSMKLSFAKNLHILLCTLGFQLMIPLGILIFSSINGPSVSMTDIYKKVNHILLQVFGLAGGVGGSVIILLFGKQSYLSVFTVHCVTGVLTCILAVFSAIFGPSILFMKPESYCSEVIRPIHKSAGTLCFLMSSVCLITGLNKPSFMKWLPVSDILPCLTIFCTFYTIIIFSVPFIRCLT